jgi:hypothetical protein
MTPADFTASHRDLVWSRRDAEPVVYLRAALLSPRFHTVLDACRAFGFALVRSEWQALQREDSPESRRVAPQVDRMLHNIETGLQHAAT